MKRIIKFHALAFLLFAGVNVFGQTTLTPGDIMLVTLNADSVKNFDFVPLVNLASETEIRFTDKPWDLTLNGGLGGWQGSEGILIYTSPTAISEGTVITYPGSTGGVWSTGGGSFNPSASGDNILVYQGTEATPTFIYGAGWASTSPWPYNNNSNTSDIPTNLSEVANTIINLGSLDNYQYNTDEGTTGDKNTLLALIGDETNWNVNDAHAFITLIASFNNTDYGQLPIQLLSFNATKINQSVEINWSTASETNNDYFTIERSIDAENFEIVKTVSGAGNSNEIINYSEIDNNPINGISYYRLKQTDFNSDFTYSEIIAVENLTDNLSLKILNTYSNPNSINFTVSNPNLENLSFEVINTLGEVLISTKVDYVIQKSKIVVNTEDLSHGLYFIKLSSDKETVVKKVLF